MFKRLDFVRNLPCGRIAMVTKVERRTNIPNCDLSRYTLQFADGTTLSNAPGYLLLPASDDEAQAAFFDAAEGGK